MSEFDDGPCSGRCTTVDFDLITVLSPRPGISQFILNDNGTTAHYCPSLCNDTVMPWTVKTVQLHLITVPSSVP